MVRLTFPSFQEIDSIILLFSRSPSIDNESLLAEIACMLIEAGAKVDQIDIDHFTPLIYGMNKIFVPNN